MKKPVSLLTGMTLIEVLLAILIFGIGILSVYGAITRAISSLQDSSRKTMAIFLAKEAMDIAMYNRNKVVSHGLPWNCVTEKLVQGRYECADLLLAEGEETALFGISYNSQGYMLEKNNPGTLGLQPGSGGFLFHSTPDNVLFTRQLIITPVIGKETHRDKILQIQSKVTYMNGSRQQEVLLTSYLGKTE